MIDRPFEQAFVLIGHDGFNGACLAVSNGIRAAANRDEAAVEAWVAIGDRINRIAMLSTVH